MLPLNTITLWEEFLQLFLKQNIPMTEVLATYEELFEVKQGSIETQGQTWERFKRILRKLIGNGVENAVQFQYFYFIYVIYNSEWVSSTQCVPKKGGLTMVPNERNELVPTLTITGWHVCIDFRKQMVLPGRTIFLYWERVLLFS